MKVILRRVFYKVEVSELERRVINGKVKKKLKGNIESFQRPRSLHPTSMK